MLASVGGTGLGESKFRGRHNQGGQRRRKKEMRTLVGDVQEYWGVYMGEGANTFWNIQYS